MKLQKAVAILLSVFLLSGCGGGSSGGGPPLEVADPATGSNWDQMRWGQGRWE